MVFPLCKNLLHRSRPIAAPRVHGQSLSSVRFVSTAPHHHSFATSYLIDKCGMPQESAFSASRHLNFQNPAKPDSVLAFFRDVGFSERQISTIVRKLPTLLVSDLQKTLVPKVEFFRSLGFSSARVANVLSQFPSILTRSLDKQIVPAVDFLRNMLQSDARIISTLNRYMLVIYHDIDAYLVPNINTLRENGVPESNIVSLLKLQPKAYMTSPAKFKEIVEEAKNMGFNPSKFTFVSAVFTATALSKSNLERKFQLFRNWGWSQEDCLQAFRRYPMYIMASEDKITKVMDFLVNTMGYHSTILVKLPNLLSLSLEKRMVPRGVVVKNLMSKGLIEKFSLYWFTVQENLFLERFVFGFENESSELLKIYQETKNESIKNNALTVQGGGDKDRELVST